MVIHKGFNGYQKRKFSTFSKYSVKYYKTKYIENYPKLPQEYNNLSVRCSLMNLNEHLTTIHYIL